MSMPYAPLPAGKHLRPRSALFKYVWLVVACGLTLKYWLWRTSTLLPPDFPPDLLFVPVLLAVAPALWELFRGQGFAAGHRQAEALLDAGDVSGAAALFDAQARRYRGDVQHVATLLSLALVALRQQDLDRALSLYSSLDHHRLGRRRTLRAVEAALARQLGFVYALKGELPAAEAWVAEFTARSGRREAGALLVNAVIGCRRGWHTQVAATFEREWRAAEAAHTVDQLRPLQLVRAFALAKTDPAGSGAQVAQLLAGVKGAGPGRFDYFGTQWPEFREWWAAQA
jgi:hypothetical protein